MTLKDNYQNGDALNASDVNAIAAAANAAETTANKGQPNGYAGLDSNGRVPVTQLPNSIMEYQGTWNANTNVPTLEDGVGNPGDVYRVGTAGSYDLGSGSISFTVSDYVIYNGSVWQKADTTDAVATVNSRTGNIVLTTADVQDANGNISANNFINGFTSTATANSTTTLTAASTRVQEFTGTANQTLVLPSTGVVAGQQFMAINNSTGSINTQASSSDVVHVLGPGVECIFTALVPNPTLPEHWEDSFYGANFAAGKVLSVQSTLTLAGTDGTTFTFPSASDTVATIAAAQTLTNKTVFPGVTSTVTAAGTTVMSAASSQVQVFTGTTTQILTLPTTSITSGSTFTVINNSSGAVTVRASDTNTVLVLNGSTSAVFTALVATPTTPAHWAYTNIGTAGQVADACIVAFGANTARAANSYGDFPFGMKLQRAITFTSVTFRVATADASGNLTVELRKNGTQVSGTSTTIASGSQVAGGTATGTWPFAAGDILSVYVTAVGSTPGKGLIADIRGLTA